MKKQGYCHSYYVGHNYFLAANKALVVAYYSHYSCKAVVAADFAAAGVAVVAAGYRNHCFHNCSVCEYRYIAVAVAVDFEYIAPVVVYTAGNAVDPPWSEVLGCY